MRRAPLSGLVAKNGGVPKHNWQRTTRKIYGGVLYLHACTACKPAHVKAYDLKITNPGLFFGSQEYSLRHGIR